MPRAVLDCSVYEQLSPEVQAIFLKNRVRAIELEMSGLASSLEKTEVCSTSLKYQLKDLQNSHSWKITAPIRALVDFFKLVVR